MKFKEVIVFWNKFFFEPIPATSLGLFRILIGSIALLKALLYLPFLQIFFTEQGIYPNSVYKQLETSTRLNIFSWLGESNSSLYFIYALFLLSALLFTIGLFTRISSVILFTCLCSFSFRNSYLEYGMDILLNQFSFLMMFAPSGTALSLDRLLAIKNGKAAKTIPLIIPWAQRLIQIQIALVYFCTFLWKMEGANWLNGTAIQIVLNLDAFKRFPIPEFFHSITFSKIMSVSTLAVEGFLGICIWFEETKYATILIGFLFHLGLDYCLNIPIFQWVTVAPYILFLNLTPIHRNRNKSL